MIPLATGLLAGGVISAAMSLCDGLFGDYWKYALAGWGLLIGGASLAANGVQSPPPAGPPPMFWNGLMVGVIVARPATRKIEEYLTDDAGRAYIRRTRT